MQVAQKVPCDAEQEHTCAQEAARSQSGHRPRTAQQQTSSKENETEASGAAVRDLRRLLACVRTRERRQDISEHHTKDECACPQRWACCLEILHWDSWHSLPPCLSISSPWTFRAMRFLAGLLLSPQIHLPVFLFYASCLRLTSPSRGEQSSPSGGSCGGAAGPKQGVRRERFVDVRMSDVPHTPNRPSSRAHPDHGALGEPCTRSSDAGAVHGRRCLFTRSRCYFDSEGTGCVSLHACMCGIC